MRSKVLVLLFLASALAPAQWSFQVGASPQASIPSSGSGGSAGGCANSANTRIVTIGGANSVALTDVNVSFTLAHSRASDLRITLHHGGTSVVLFDQHVATSGKQFGGTYGFDDEQPSTIAAAAIPNQALLAPGAYKPHASLSAFDGVSAAGPWIVEICDLVSGDVGTLHACMLTIWAEAWVTALIPAPVPIADGGPYGCYTPVTRVINVPAGAGPVSKLNLICGLTHGRAADLRITLAHGPVSVTIAAPNTPASNAYLNDLYWFTDDASSSWDQALAAWGGGAIPGYSYRPDSPFTAFDGVEAGGPWFLTICDSVPGNVGDLNYLALSYQTYGFDFELLQPWGPSSITLKNTGGVPGNFYVNAFTLQPGSYPSGWLHGLDISMVDLANQINWGVPFFGMLDSSGGATVTIPGLIPTNLALQFTSIELTPAGVAVASIPARTYTTVQ
jgi:subtilisin-like proprotein convertase family protein